MVTSMTGFGRGSATEGDVTVVVELRSVNNRFLDVSVRVPREYAPLESGVQRAVRERLARGRVDVTVRRQGLAAGGVVVADQALFDSYVAAATALLGPDGPPVAPAFVLAQPGVLSVVAESVDASSEQGVLMAALAEALDRLVAMRVAEGDALAADLRTHLALAGAEVDAIEAIAADLDARLRERLSTRMVRLLGEAVEPWRIAQEAALLAEKADVSEEVARLRSHLQQVTATLDGGDGNDAIGRRLDFLLQEIHREVNTIGSKAADHPVSHRVVELKTLLERMREQAANVE